MKARRDESTLFDAQKKGTDFAPLRTQKKAAPLDTPCARGARKLDTQKRAARGPPHAVRGAKRLHLKKGGSGAGGMHGS
jgi:hypothetical protein